ncbi:hypothetical protein ALI22I_28700 [Saccharothrix sp. ALI-22-I]|uniref:hypothetical protein n=1 Tax=Saccharothrix sp. ALI-22-I TaxID=1933778 RepID=UPI00097C1CF7|nr:hypothetical protein [Saccharothrix sp. ALI-22-I]ONI84536.1 hypothetical protein ALI22I_28700 [Saccharothrix sp. ALI-22-I]
MSGITAVTYVVESKDEQRRRRQREEWERYSARRAELSALRAEADAYRTVFGAEVAKIPAAPRARPGSAPERIAAAAEETGELVAKHRERLRESVAVAAKREALRTVAAAVPVPAADQGERVATGKFTRKPTADEERERELRARSERVRQGLVDKATEQLARLPAYAPEQTRIACTQAVAELSTTPSEARARLLLADLVGRVRREVEAEQDVQETHTALEALSARLEAVAPADSAGLRQEIAALLRARARKVPEALPGRVTALVDAADRAHRRKQVAAALRLSLEDLQYQVTEGFETVLAAEGFAYASLPDRPGYGVKLLLDAGQDKIRTQVVRSERLRPDGTADADAEQGFCAQYPTLLSRLRKHGVEPGDPGLRPPGQGTVAPVAEELIPAAETGRHESHQRRQEMRS